MGLRRRELGLHGVLDLVGRLRPDLDELLAALVVGDDALAVLLLDLLGALLVLVQDLLLLRRRRDVLDAERDARPGGVVEPEVLEVVEDVLDLRAVVAVDDSSTRRATSGFRTGSFRYSKSSGNAALNIDPADGRSDDRRAIRPLLGLGVVPLRQQLVGERLARRAAPGSGRGAEWPRSSARRASAAEPNVGMSSSFIGPRSGRAVR